MQRRGWVSLVLLPILFVPISKAAADNGSPQSPDGTEAALTSGSIRSFNAGPLGTSTTTPYGGGLQLSFQDGKGQASLAYGGTLLSDSKSLPWPTSIPLSLNISAPLASTSSSSGSSSNTQVGSGLDNFAASNQLPNGFEISAKLGFFAVKLIQPSTAEAISFNSYSQATRCESDQGKNLSAKEKLPNKTVHYNCIHAVSLAEDGYGSELQQDNTFVSGSIVPALQYATATYYTAKNLTKETTSHFLPSITAYISAGDFSFGTAIDARDETWKIGTLGFDYAGTYKTQVVKVECLNKSGASILSCVNGSIGSPNSKVSDVGFLQLNFGYGTGDFNVLGTNITNVVFVPKVSHDAADGESSVDFPIYFLTAGASSTVGSGGSGIGGVIPGIDMSWDGIKHDFIIGAFLTTGFDASTGKAGSSP